LYTQRKKERFNVPNMNDNLRRARECTPPVQHMCVITIAIAIPCPISPVLITDRVFCKDTVTGEYSLRHSVDCPPSVFSGNLKVVDHPAFQTDRYSDAQKVALTHTPNPFNSRIRNNRTMTEIDTQVKV